MSSPVDEDNPWANSQQDESLPELDEEGLMDDLALLAPKERSAPHSLLGAFDPSVSVTIGEVSDLVDVDVELFEELDSSSYSLDNAVEALDDEVDALISGEFPEDPFNAPTRDSGGQDMQALMAEPHSDHLVLDGFQEEVAERPSAAPRPSQAPKGQTESYMAQLERRFSERNKVPSADNARARSSEIDFPLASGTSGEPC